jgi:microcin C transport system substrate-binding protein
LYIIILFNYKDILIKLLAIQTKILSYTFIIGEKMKTYIKLLCLTMLFIGISTDFLNAKKMKFKGGPKTTTTTTILSEDALESNGWITNKNIIPTGSPNAKKGGMITMLGGNEFPSTFRSIGKDSRQQINGLIEALQYETLLSFNYEKLEWSPSLATHWKISSDSLTYWFRLNPDAKWADGKDVVAKDIVETFKLLIDSGHQDPNVANYWDELFETPVSESKYIVRVKAKKKDWRTFQSMAWLTVYPSTYLSKVDGSGFLEKYDFNFMPGSGPYTYDRESSKKGNEGYVILKRRENYWAKDEIANIGINNFDKIKFIFIEDENQQVISFFNGDYDVFPWSRAQWWVERFNSEKYEEIKNGWVQKIKIFNYLPKGPSGIIFNTQKKPFDNIDIRKAFAYLFDVDKLNKRLFFNEYVRLNTYFYGTPYANPKNPMLDYNPQKALVLLNNAGWNRLPGNQWLTNSEGTIFEFDFLIAPGGDRIYTTLQEDLKNVGIKMNFKQVDAATKFSKVMKKEFDVSNQGWTAGFFPSPEGMMHSKYADEVEVTNVTSMNYSEIDDLIEKYNKEWDAKKRVPLAQKIDSIAVNSYHYCLGWTSPYGARMLYWNKFGMPESGISYVGDWRSPISLWWNDEFKEKKLYNAQSDNVKLPNETEIIDHWNTLKK